MKQKGTNEILSSNAKEVLNKTNKTAMVVDSIDKFEKSDNKMQTAKEPDTVMDKIMDSIQHPNIDLNA